MLECDDEPTMPVWRGSYEVWYGGKKVMTIISRDSADTEASVRRYVTQQLGMSESVLVKKIRR